MEKQTAVEKFIEQLEEKGGSWENVSIGMIQISIKVEDYLELQRQAEAMEKEQIIKAYKRESCYMKHAGCTDEQINKSAVNYYNETFK